MTAWLDALLEVAGPWVPWLLAAASLLEYVFPPFPGDTVTLLGAVLAVRGSLSPWVVYAAVNAGALVGAAVDWGAGAYLRHHLDRPSRLSEWLNRRVLTPSVRRHVEAEFARWGPWLLVLNRFVPGTRALVFVVAGMVRIRFVTAMVLGGVSSLVWNGVLLGAGYLVGARLEHLEAFVTSLNRAGLAAFALAVGVIVALVWRRRRRKARPPA